MGKLCFMFGHRRVYGDIEPRLIKAIEDEYLKGVRNFVVGNRGAFDAIAARVVYEMKKVHADIRLSLLLAYHPAERPVSRVEMLYFDNSYYPLMGDVPRRFAIVRANRYMIENCESVICYVNGIGNARDLLEKAERLKISVTNVGKEIVMGT